MYALGASMCRQEEPVILEANIKGGYMGVPLRGI